MPASFHGNSVWRILQLSARQCQSRSYVAVPYFSQAGSRLLPLKRGDVLVVNASASAVRSGQTCPAALQRLVKKGVKVFSLENLHAKVYVLGKVAYVGSANASTSSRDRLVEAIAEIRDRTGVAAAQAFVASLCNSRVGTHELERLAKIYRPPRAGTPRQSRVALKPPRLWIAHISHEDPDEDFELQRAMGHRLAKAKRSSSRHKIDEFWYPGEKRFAIGDSVVQVFTDADGVVEILSLGTVIDRRIAYPNGRKTTFVYLEALSDRGIPLAKAKKALGRSVFRRLGRPGLLGRGVVRERLITYLAMNT